MPNLVRCLTILLVIFRTAAPEQATAQTLRADTLIAHFPFNRSAIRPADSTAIARYFQDKTHTGMDSVHIIGYTDTIGSERYNLRLSQSRARSLAVVAVLSGFVPVSCWRSLAQVE